jgi:antitoxin component YwqK of YwqJK toxin-antitoxin module
MNRFFASLLLFLVSTFASTTYAQTFEVVDGDTINKTLANGMKQGFWRYFWANGDMKYEVFYEQNEKEGLEIRYFDDQDCIEFSNTYKNGILDGPSVTFFPNCAVKCEELYRGGKKQGYERCYESSGALLTEGNFDKGELIGTYSHFDKKGYVTYESPTKETTLKFDKFLSGEYKIKDSTIFKVFERNSWKKVMLVVDMTGSMFPYIGQLLVWYKMNFETEQVKYYSLFNDGDNIADTKKIIGNTGGVHVYDAKDFKKFKKDLEDVRKMGEGGDDPENDIEALYKSILARRDFADLVLLADDSDIRDMKLLRRIRKPVHIILCGTKRGINQQYLQLAYHTKGSIHTLNNSVYMKNLKDGDRFDLDNDVFEFRAGEFIWLDAKNMD